MIDKFKAAVEDYLTELYGIIIDWEVKCIFYCYGSNVETVAIFESKVVEDMAYRCVYDKSLKKIVVEAYLKCETVVV